MLAGRVRAAAAGLYVTAVVQAVVVTGHDLVEHGLLVLAGRVRMVVDDVHDDAQSHVVEALNHLAELAHAHRALGVGRIAALGRRVVPRVVAPVEAVQVRGRGHRRLLLLRIGRIGCEHRGVGCLPVRLVLIDRCDVEHGQQVHVRQPGSCQCAEVQHAFAAVQRERLVGALVLVGYRRVVGREVPDVQLVDRDVLGRRQRRLHESVPARRLQRRVAEIDDLAAGAVHRETQRVRIRHDVGLGRAGGRHVDLDLEQVVLAEPV